jgi:integrase
MPIKLIPPRQGKTPYWYGRGTHLKQFVDRSTGAVRKSVAKKVVAKWELDIESGIFAPKGEPTFLSAAVAYGKAGGDRRPIQKLIAHFGETALRLIDQDAIDAAALALFPTQTPATRNREVYTPVSAVLKSANVLTAFRRPKGAGGRVLTGWLWPEQAERLIAEATRIDAEFGLFNYFLLYTGLRLREGSLWFSVDQLRLSEAFAYIPKTKNGEPRPVHLPAHLVVALANHPRGLERPGERVFRFHPGGRLYAMLYAAAEAAQVELPDREAFHIYRHTFGAWMRRYGGADTTSLVAGGTWKSRQSASRYEHAVVNEEAKRSDLMPMLGLKKASG